MNEMQLTARSFRLHFYDSLFLTLGLFQEAHVVEGDLFGAAHWFVSFTVAVVLTVAIRFERYFVNLAS